ENGYREVVLVDTNIPFAGLSLYQLGEDGIKDWLKWKHEEKGTIYRVRDGARTYSFVTNGLNDLASFVYNTLCTHSMKITDVMRDWGKEKIDIILAIPDFIFDEMGIAMEKNFHRFIDHYRKNNDSCKYVERKKMWRWVREVARGSDGLFVKLYTPFGKRLNNRMLNYHINNHLTEYEKKAWEDISSYLGSDDADRALIFTALRILESTDLDVSIVSDNTRDFSYQLADALQMYPVDKKCIGIYTSTDFCNLLAKNKVRLPLGEKEAELLFEPYDKRDWRKDVPYE
ncbi:MAG: hypothetical protein ACE5J7_02785, partial [Candidatus Aenigmatarchaeota archaeon]